MKNKWLFFKSALPDFLLVLALSCALVLTVSFAFESVPAYRSNPFIATAICAPSLLICYAGTISRRAVLPAALATVAYSVLVCWLAIAIMPEGVPIFVDSALNDVAENYLTYAVICVVVPPLVFLLSRRAVGLVFLFLLSTITCAWVQFLYRDWAENNGLLISVLVLVLTGMLFVFQTYRTSVLGAKRAKKTMFGFVLLYAGLLSCACAAIAAAVFFGILQPLGLQTLDVRPFQEYYSVPEIEYSGVYDNQQVESDTKTTNQTNDEQKDSNQNAEGGQESDTSEEPQADPSSPVQQFMSQFSDDSWNQEFNPINYETFNHTAIIVTLCILAFVAALILLRRSRRLARLKKIESKPAAYQVCWLYNFINSRLKRLKIERPKTLTPMEFALTSQRRLLEFSEGTGGVDYVRITDIYQRTCFGANNPTAAELKDIKAYYLAFFKNARHYSGNIKWLWRFWRI